MDSEFVKRIIKYVISLNVSNWIVVAVVGVFIGIFVFMWCIKYIDKLLLFKGWICGLYSKFSLRAKKGQMANQVRGVIKKSVRKHRMNNENVLPDDLKIEWVDVEKQETFVNNNKVIIRIKQSSNPHENLVTAVSGYVNNGLLYNVRKYLHKEVIEATNVYMIRKIIQEASSDTLTYLDENYLIPKLKENQSLKEDYEKLVKIDHNGMFIGIMLNEFYKAGMSLFGELEDPELFAESGEFMRFLYDIAIGVSDDYSRLTFNRDYFKVAIFLAASNKTLKRKGIRPFIKAIAKKLDEGIETIYVFGLGSKREIAETISNEVSSDIRINSINKHAYRHIKDNGRRIPGVFYECGVYKEDVMDI